MVSTEFKQPAQVLVYIDAMNKMILLYIYLNRMIVLKIFDIYFVFFFFASLFNLSTLDVMSGNCFANLDQLYFH